MSTQQLEAFSKLAWKAYRADESTSNAERLPYLPTDRKFTSKVSSS
jgi:hypothetical protein